MPFRIEALDAQRFYPSTRSLRSTSPSLVTQATLGHDEVVRPGPAPVSILDFGISISDSPTASFTDTDSASSVEGNLSDLTSNPLLFHGSNSSIYLDLDAQRYDVSKSRHRRNLFSVDSGIFQARTESSSDLEADSSSSTIDDVSDTSSTQSLVPVSLEYGTAIHESNSVEAVTHDQENSTTCTIIRQAHRSSIFGALNCFGSASAFEDDVHHIQVQKAKERTGKADLRVFVTETRETFREESWRGAVQEILYCGTEQNQVASVASRGE
ncbi:hypothetical protein D9615_009167 [Tricholomella constricta]|uniref:Uncharacterized protein n=1 Tax=Tricholomella constricta TaxID=117010 RepID=A0A8H5H2K9_9AGAR|nr:hypothetical protein D9615_009167 [Tricholomella constricta]